MYFYKEIVTKLLELIPEFKNSEDFKDVSDQLDLPYIIFGSLRRFYLKSYKEGKKELVKKISDFLEEMAVSELKVQELIAYGFLENLDENADYYHGIIDTFGPNTKKQLADVDEFWRRYEEAHKKEN